MLPFFLPLFCIRFSPRHTQRFSLPASSVSPLHSFLFSSFSKKHFLVVYHSSKTIPKLQKMQEMTPRTCKNTLFCKISSTCTKTVKDLGLFCKKIINLFTFTALTTVSNSVNIYKNDFYSYNFAHYFACFREAMLQNHRKPNRL